MLFVMFNAHAEGTVELFCSYSHEDRLLQRRFHAHTADLRRRKQVQVWTDQRIGAGGDWEGEIDAHLNTADLIVLLISADFMNSDFCYTKEMTRALERQAAKEARVIPIIIQPCDWTDAPFAALQALPPDAKAVTLWPNQEEAWSFVAIGLKKAVLAVLDESRQRVDLAKASAIMSQLGADVVKQQMERTRILRATQRKILEITADVQAAQTTTSQKMFEKWDKYLRA